jgi:hypothetical protein
MEATIHYLAIALGLVGMAGVWLVPYRGILAVKSLSRGHGFSLVASVIALTLVSMAAWVAADTLPRVFRCLWERSCTGTRGGGLFQLALFGLAATVVELVWQVLRAIERARSRRRHSEA